MRILLIFSSLLLISACQNLTRGISVSPSHSSVAVAQPSAGQWLLVRSYFCDLPPEQLETATEARREMLNDQHQIEMLLLATCRSEVIREGFPYDFDRVRDNPAWSPEQRALVGLIRDQMQANILLQRENDNLRKQLDSMIEGILDIESEMDSLRSKGHPH